MNLVVKEGRAPETSYPVAAVTVTYNPNLDLLEQQLNALSCVELVVFVDNGSDSLIKKGLKQFKTQFDNLYICELAENVGIAKAQNIGAQHAVSQLNKLEYLLFLDHDTVPSEKSIERLYCRAVEIAAYSQIGVIGPKLVDPRTNAEYGFHRFRSGRIERVFDTTSVNVVIKCDQVNSSGSFIPVKSWEQVGAFREDFFIDHVETEWCFRASSKGFGLYGVFNAEMEHEMGDDNCKYWLFGWRSMPYRSPLRHYYIVRNSLFLQKQSYVPVWWKFYNVFKLLFTFSYFGFLSKDNKLHRRYIISGFKDGWCGKMGKL